MWSFIRCEFTSTTLWLILILIYTHTRTHKTCFIKRFIKTRRDFFDSPLPPSHSQQSSMVYWSITLLSTVIMTYDKTKKQHHKSSSELKWDNLHVNCQKQKVILMFKTFSGQTPRYLKEMFRHRK